MSNIEQVKIGNLGNTITGKTPSSNQPEDFGDECLFVTPSDNLDNKWIAKTERYLSRIGLNRLKGKMLPPKSILVSCIGSAMGKVAINRTKCITNQQINSIIIDAEKYCPDYIYYVIKNNHSLLRNAAIGSTALPLLNKTDFDRIEIPIHSEKIIQQEIASILSALDNKIELNNRINDNLEQMAKAIYNYWFIQFDFPDENGRPYKSSGGKIVWNDVLKRDVPNGWKIENILEIGDLLGGGTPKTSVSEFWDGHISFFTPSDATNSFFVIETEKRISESGLQSCSSAIYRKGTIFLTARGTVGKVNIAGTDMAMNQSCYAVAPKLGINSAFLHQHCLSLVQFLKAKGNGSIFDAIVSNDIKLTKTTIPNSRLIEAYGLIATPIYEKILVNLTENKKLSILRDWLLPMLMNGQVKID